MAPRRAGPSTRAPAVRSRPIPASPTGATTSPRSSPAGSPTWSSLRRRCARHDPEDRRVVLVWADR